MSNELEVLNSILEKVSNIENSLNISTSALLYVIGFLFAAGVCYLLYRAISNFISF
ncbi:MAG: hypothetical protein HFJ58_02220 [Clostridia bacterium]|nr:hypothetical protein [Clostridia bacterium]